MPTAKEATVKSEPSEDAVTAGIKRERSDAGEGGGSVAKHVKSELTANPSRCLSRLLALITSALLACNCIPSLASLLMRPDMSERGPGTISTCTNNLLDEGDLRCFPVWSQ